MRNEKQGWMIGGIRSIKDNCLSLSWGVQGWCLWGGQSMVEALECTSVDC